MIDFQLFMLSSNMMPSIVAHDRPLPILASLTIDSLESATVVHLDPAEILHLCQDAPALRHLKLRSE